MTALERATAALRVEVERQVQANGSYSGPANGSPNYVDTELDYGLLVRAVLMAVREPDDAMQFAGGRSIFDRPHLFNPVGRENWPKWEDQTLLNRELSALSCHAHRAMIDAILNEKDATND